MKLRLITFVLPVVSLLALGACSKQNKPKRFELADPNRSGIDFINHIEESDSFNVMTFSNIYTGGGVGVGDVNGDGRTDVFLGGNMESSRLYLNRGPNARPAFLDITEKAGVRTERWIGGVAMVDINQDGRLDIYLSCSGSNQPARRANLLFVNQGIDRDGIPRFREMGQACGLADTSYTTQSAFLDYDRDGDLDAFLIVNYPELYYGGQVNVPIPIRKIGQPHKIDRLLRNDGPGPDGHPVFTDVSYEAGIVREGYSLGVAVGDLNQDGWPDIYIANDFLSDDVLYINNGDGTFTDRLRDYFDHTSYAGMGTDMTDLNNDGLLDVAELDMLSRDNQRLKSMIGGINYNRHAQQIRTGYSHQYTRNTLQINNGRNATGDFSFSEVSQLAGIFNTDWSWSVLMSDYDNDGQKDVWITNGFRRDMGDLDFINYGFESDSFDPEFLQQTFLDQAHQLPGIHVSNFLFKNTGGLRFTDKTKDWGLDKPSYSHGAAFADLDGDGDLELLASNLEAPVFLFWNRSREQDPEQSHFLRIQLEGTPPNRQGIGAKISLVAGGRTQYHEHYLTRGFLSSMDPTVHFGLGEQTLIDSLLIEWPDGKWSVQTGISADQTLTVRQATAARMPAEPPLRPAALMRESPLPGLQALHQEAHFVDFDYQPLVPHRQSQNGPGLAVGDLDGNGLDDIYVGGGKNFPGRLFFQENSGRFRGETLPGDHRHEDLGCLFFDADGDEDLDLYIVSGSVEHGYDSPLYRDRLYVNDGTGRLSESEEALPEAMQSSGTCVAAADYDRDGDLDLFVGGGALPGRYPLCSKSYLLRNDSEEADQPLFRDVTASADDLSQIGMVKSALWSDVNGDEWVDLILVGEFMPITVFENQAGELVRRTDNGLTRTGGWWNSIAGADFDLDGDIDYIAGNFGLNNKYQASPEEPLCIYTKDFDENGAPDPVMCHFVAGKNVPVPYRDDLLKQLVKLKSKYPDYDSYARATLQDLFSPKELEDAQVLKCEMFSSVYLDNDGAGHFQVRSLPIQAQYAPVFGIQVQHINEDHYPDVLLVGNLYGNETSGGRYDAFEGCVLVGRGDGTFSFLPSGESNFYVPGDARAMAEIVTADQNAWLLIGQNRDSLRAWPAPRAFESVYPLAGGDVWATVTYPDGRRERREYYYGSGYLSQSSRNMKIGGQVTAIEVTSFRGETRRFALEIGSRE